MGTLKIKNKQQAKKANENKITSRNMFMMMQQLANTVLHSKASLSPAVREKFLAIQNTKFDLDHLTPEDELQIYKLYAESYQVLDYETNLKHQEDKQNGYL